MNKCLLCQNYLSNQVTIGWLLSLAPSVNSVICNKCQNRFNRLADQPTCTSCNKLGIESEDCEDCLEWQAKTDFQFVNHSLYQYNVAMKEFMHRYKFVGDYQLRTVFAAELSESATASGRVIVPIPLTPITLQRRGFNQTLGLLQVQTIECLLTKNHQKNIDQSQRGRDQRKAMEQPFIVDPKLIGRIAQRDVLIVDDVYTTGTTIRFAARLLIENGAKSVQGLTLAR
ncbi:ComF family protein [Nicoliella spurrieriana]|uniref:ComF family protein n=1 Tax=Nicoliella spurrieriana TaxID=2925830 RepID=A0A976X5Q0_9LACO|nr:ComF family protein [Nicoliella spurrieriana]UQS86986.1 ComF family protein [Nicoliella spurrieriana]